MHPKIEKLSIVNENKPGTDCGLEHELLIAKFRLKLNKVWKTTRAFRYDLNQIPYDYTAEVTNGFRVLDLVIESLKNYGWRSIILYKRQQTKSSPTKIKAKRPRGCQRRLHK